MSPSMAMRFGAASVVSRSSLCRFMEGARGGGAFTRYFSEDKGRILSEEERAKENVYIQKMERERMEKMKRKLEKEKESADKKPEGETHKG